MQWPSVPHGNTSEMSSIIYANQHCEMTSFTPPPIAVLSGDPVALKEELLGNLEGELPKQSCLGYLRTMRSLHCLPWRKECLPEETGAWGEES